MDARARSAAINILENHPDFEREFEDRMPRVIGKDRDRWVFRQAIAWPQLAHFLNNALDWAKGVPNRGIPAPQQGIKDHPAEAVFSM